MRKSILYCCNSDGWFRNAIKEGCRRVLSELLQQISPNVAAPPGLTTFQLGRKFFVGGLSNGAGKSVLLCKNAEGLRSSHANFVYAPAAKLANQLNRFSECCQGTGAV